jgi:hypothetical protein
MVPLLILDWYGLTGFPFAVTGMMLAQRRSYRGMVSICFPVDVMMEAVPAEKREKLAGAFGLRECRPLWKGSIDLTKHYRKGERKE